VWGIGPRPDPSVISDVSVTPELPEHLIMDLACGLVGSLSVRQPLPTTTGHTKPFAFSDATQNLSVDDKCLEEKHK